VTHTAGITDVEQIGADAARPTLGGLGRRWHQRRTAGAQLRRLTGYAGTPLVVSTTAVHLLAGLAPVVFMIGTGLALDPSAAGDAA